MSELLGPDLTKELENNYQIVFGVPTQSDTLTKEGRKLIRPPYKPHIFYSSKTILIQPEQSYERFLNSFQIHSRNLQRTYGISLTPPPTREYFSPTNQRQVGIVLEDLMVIMGHGYTTGQTVDSWRFIQTGKTVKQTVDAYNKVADQFRWRPIDLIVSCRPQNTSPYLHSENHPTPITYIRDINRPVIRPSAVVTVNHDRHPNLSRFIPNQGAELILVVPEKGEWCDIQYHTAVRQCYPYSHQFQELPPQALVSHDVEVQT